jgi:hypothetical protein
MLVRALARIRVVLLRKDRLQTRTSTCSDQRGASLRAPAKGILRYIARSSLRTNS